MIEGMADSSEMAREQQFWRAVSRSGPCSLNEMEGRREGMVQLGLAGARAGHLSAAGCGRRWRARLYSKGNSKWSVQASAGFILKSGDSLHSNPKPSDLPENGRRDGRLSVLT